MQKEVSVLALGALLLLVGAGCTSTPQEDSSLTFSYPDRVTQSTSSWAFPGELPQDQIQQKQVRISTDKGDIVFELFSDTAPKTVSNFVYLTQGEYFNGLTFHRREEGFVIQGGDPSGNGTGGPGYDFEDELQDDYGYERGIVAMANRGPDTNGSQFFIMLADVPLPKAYTVFGRVTQGMDVVDAIAIGDKMTSVVVEPLAQ